RVLQNVSVELAARALNVVIGPNGTGKSSLLKAVAGLVPSAGVVSFNGRVLGTPSAKSEWIAYMQQDIGPTSSLTVLEVVLLGRLRQLGFSVPRSYRTEAMEMLEHLGVGNLAARTLPELSGGQRQLVYLAQSLFRRPKILLLDEPTAALDLRHQLLVIDAVRSYARVNNSVVIAAMHDLNLCARFSDRVLCLSNGSIFADGSPQDVLTSGNIETMYRVQTRIIHDEDGQFAITPIAAVSYEKEEIAHAAE
ncbi:MAG: ABC transporter ATP-binding protein, partial [Pseudomonadota bacterium]